MLSWLLSTKWDYTRIVPSCISHIKGSICTNMELPKASIAQSTKIWNVVYYFSSRFSLNSSVPSCTSCTLGDKYRVVYNNNLQLFRLRSVTRIFRSIDTASFELTADMLSRPRFFTTNVRLGPLNNGKMPSWHDLHTTTQHM